jgi:hypothetical protein
MLTSLYLGFYAIVMLCLKDFSQIGFRVTLQCPAAAATDTLTLAARDAAAAAAAAAAA